MESIEVNFYENVEDELLKFAVIVSRANGKLVFCKHKQRNTYEIPGGHREAGETIIEAAKRELIEETGAARFSISPVCVYSVKGKTRVNKSSNDISFGMIFFADIVSFEKELHSEIEKIIITNDFEHDFTWTYPAIQPKLLEEVRRRGYLN